MTKFLGRLLLPLPISKPIYSTAITASTTALIGPARSIRQKPERKQIHY